MIWALVSQPQGRCCSKKGSCSKKRQRRSIISTLSDYKADYKATFLITNYNSLTQLTEVVEVSSPKSKTPKKSLENERISPTPGHRHVSPSISEKNNTNNHKIIISGQNHEKNSSSNHDQSFRLSSDPNHNHNANPNHNQNSNPRRPSSNHSLGLNCLSCIATDVLDRTTDVEEEKDETCENNTHFKMKEQEYPVIKTMDNDLSPTSIATDTQSDINITNIEPSLDNTGSKYNTDRDSHCIINIPSEHNSSSSSKSSGSNSRRAKGVSVICKKGTVKDVHSDKDRIEEDNGGEDIAGELNALQECTENHTDDYHHGYHDGYLRGHNDSWVTAYHQGYHQGWNEGYQNAYHLGYEAGVQQGRSVGDNLEGGDG